MAAPLTLELMSKVATCRLSPLTFSQYCKKYNATLILKYAMHNTPQASIFSNRITYPCASSMSTGPPCLRLRETSDSSRSILPSTLLYGQKHALPWCLVLSRHYGRKMIQKPPKITHFEYSGDLRTLPELDKTTILSKYKGLENELESNEVLRKLSSLEFASAEEYAEHRRQLIKDRIIELFGPDSEIEQQIALLTLGIRQMIPYCIKYRTDKVNKINLLKRIFRRRRLLTRLREIDHERFEWLLRELKIRYVIPREREPHKGWKHDLRVATQDEATTKQRKKLEELKAKFEAEKKVFFEHKAKVLTEIEEDLQKMGLDRSFLEQILLENRKASSKQKYQHKQQNITSHVAKT